MHHLDRIALALTVAVVLVAVALPITALPTTAQGPAPNPALAGTWRLQGSVPQAQARVEAAIAPAIQTLAPDIQRLARARIAETTWVPQTIQVQTTAANISITYAGQENRTFETGVGQSRNVFSRSGVRATLTQTFRPDGGIEQQIRALDGTQWNILSAHGATMHLDILMQSRRLTQDIRFRLVYGR